LKIRDEIIDRVREAADIVDVISDYVTFKRKGQNMMACCPFHNEKTPSFSVSPTKGIYKCFGCGKAGDNIQFIMDIEGLGYLEAIAHLGKKYGIEIELEESSNEVDQAQNERESLYIVLNFAKNYFKEALKSSEGNAIGLSYFKERGFSPEIIEKFELGYSMDIWDGLLKSAKENNYNEDLLEKAGLIIRNENKTYDRFRARVIFPIHNISGRVIAFGARILKTDKNQPKYLNSPETGVYHKSDILYGLHQAKQSIRQEQNCFLVEGYTDVVSLQQAGIENVVASSGTSLTSGQIKLIGRYSKDITVLYDGDNAGIKASLRGIDMILEEDLNVKAVVFPEGEDPDSYVKKIGGTEFKKYIKANQKDFITFKTELYLSDIGNDPLKKAELIKEIVESISKIPDAIKRSVFFKQCATLLDIDESVLIAEGNKTILTKRKKESERPRENLEGAENVELPEMPGVSLPLEINSLELQERETIRLLLNYGTEKLDETLTVHTYIFQELEDVDFQHIVYREMFATYKKEIEKGVFPAADFFLKHENASFKQETITLISVKYEVSNNWADKFKIIVPSEKDTLFNLAYFNVLRLKYRKIQELIKENHAQMLKAVEIDEQIQFMKVEQELKTTKTEIAKLLGMVV